MLSPAKKKYLLAIYELGKGKDDVPSADIAKSLNVRRSAVSKMLRIMAYDNLIHKENYGKVQLNSQSIQMAKRLHTEYMQFYCFFHEWLHASKEDSKADAMVLICGLSRGGAKNMANLLSNF